MQLQDSQPTSLSLLQRATSNDQQAWRQIVHLYGPLVHRWCRRSGLNDDDTADVFQDTFAAVLQNLDSFRPSRSVGSFRSWLRTIVRTKVADHFRRRGRQPAARGGTDAQLHMANLADPPAALPDDTDEEAESDHAQVVRRAMELIKAEFTEQNWRAFVQVAQHGRSAADVARELGVNPQAVRQANYRIRRRLRVILQDLMDV